MVTGNSDERASEWDRIPIGNVGLGEGGGTGTDNGDNIDGSGSPARRRGRPRKEESEEATSLRVENEGLNFSPAPEIQRSRGRKKKVGVLGDKNAKYLVTMCESFLDLAAGSLIGEYAALKPQEQDFIEPPAIRLVGRMPVDIGEQSILVIDALMLAFGLGTWALRVYTERPKVRRETIQHPPSTNGHSPEPAQTSEGMAREGVTAIDPYIREVIDGF